jgi:hypothetical protein
MRGDEVKSPVPDLYHGLQIGIISVQKSDAHPGENGGDSIDGRRWLAKRSLIHQKLSELLVLLQHS